VVKGWHYHKKQIDNMVVIKGMMKVVLYDSRKDSKTYGEVNEFFEWLYGKKGNNFVSTILKFGCP
jgi:dTDP-4-dehydrorhamnose 3,5-epimerase